jgi:hypothetical protein
MPSMPTAGRGRGGPASPWRIRARLVILAALAAGRERGLAGRDLERYVRGHYPFGPRSGWPYKVWLHELNGQVRGLWRPVGKRSRRPRPGGPIQLDLFDGEGRAAVRR